MNEDKDIMDLICVGGPGHGKKVRVAGATNRTHYELYGIGVPVTPGGPEVTTEDNEHPYTRHLYEIRRFESCDNDVCNTIYFLKYSGLSYKDLYLLLLDSISKKESNNHEV